MWHECKCSLSRVDTYKRSFCVYCVFTKKSMSREPSGKINWKKHMLLVYVLSMLHGVLVCRPNFRNVCIGYCCLTRANANWIYILRYLRMVVFGPSWIVVAHSIVYNRIHSLYTNQVHNINTKTHDEAPMLPQSKRLANRSTWESTK